MTEHTWSAWPASQAVGCNPILLISLLMIPWSMGVKGLGFRDSLMGQQPVFTVPAPCHDLVSSTVSGLWRALTV